MTTYSDAITIVHRLKVWIADERMGDGALLKSAAALIERLSAQLSNRPDIGPPESPVKIDGEKWISFTDYEALHRDATSLSAQLAERDAEIAALKLENEELRGACLSDAMQATPLTPHGQAIAAGDGTLHGAIDYWQEQAFKMAAGQCCVKSGGLMADDHGNTYCDMERRVAELRGRMRVMTNADALESLAARNAEQAKEIERLKGHAEVMWTSHFISPPHDYFGAFDAYRLAYPKEPK